MRETIKNNGWRQGSLIRVSDWPYPNDFPEEWRSVVGGFAVVVSQSCDVLHSKLEVEPVVDVMLLCPVEQVSRKASAGGEPRRLHLDLITDGEAIQVEATPARRMLLNRQRLCEVTPCADARLAPSEAVKLGVWFARRYQRLALPDEFERDLGKCTAFKKWVEKHEGAIDRILLRYQPSSSEPGRFHVHWLIVREPIGAIPIADVDQLGIDLKAAGFLYFEREDYVTVVGADEITLVEIERYSRFDSFDHISSPAWS